MTDSQDEKHQLSKLDFSDLEHDTLRILTKLDSNGQRLLQNTIKITLKKSW